MQDYARSHTSHVVQNYVADVEINAWPACSSDLNPIEHILGNV